MIANVNSNRQTNDNNSQKVQLTMTSRSDAGNVTYRVPRALRRKISRSEDLCMTVAASLLVGMFNHNSSRIQPHIATHPPGRCPMLLPCHGCLIACQLASTELFAIAGRRPPWIAPMSVVFDSRSHGASFRSVFGWRQPLPQHRKDHGFLAPKEQTSIPITYHAQNHRPRAMVLETSHLESFHVQ
jgi:hypothetical protein